MMNSNELFKMYQAWQQGNENYVRDWVNFVEWAAKWNQTTCDEIMKELQKHYWFKRTYDDNK
jgi:hypothetical protein